MAALRAAFLQKPCLSAASSSRRRCSSGAAEADHCGLRAPHAVDLRLHANTSHAARMRVAAQAAAVETSSSELPTRPKLGPHMEVMPAPAPSRMVNNNRAWVEEHRIRGAEAGPDQRTHISSIANIIQEVASNHAVAMWGRSEQGFAADPALADQGLIFVMTRLQIQMDEYPKWGDAVSVETWFMPAGKIGAQRDFLISCARTGRRLGRATSNWVMLNLNTRRLARVPEEARNRCFLFAEEEPARQAIPPGYTKVKIPEVDLPAEIEGPMQVARRSDIDMNGHVNNVTYLAWGLETVPLDIYDNCHLYQVEVDFKAECHCGDAVESLAQRSVLPEAMATNGAGPEPLAFVHTIRRCEGEACTELVRMRTVWRAGEVPKP